MSIKQIIYFLCSLVLMFSSVTASAKQILIYGDSLSAAYGLELEQGWAQLLAERLEGEHRVFNASISGESSAGGLARLPATLDEVEPDLVLLELGANDGLRGYSTAQLESNLASMIEMIQQRGATAVVFGITLPPSYGPRYIDAFEAVFSSVAAASQQPYFNFAVEHFIGNDKYIQADGLHPTLAAQAEIEQRVFDYLTQEKLLD